MSDIARGEVAIIGMSCIYPGAGNVQQFWENILQKVDAISDPPPEWEAERFFDPDSQANDRIYCKRGGFLGKLAEFNPTEYGVMPNAVDGASPDHFLTLRVAVEALADAGYADPARLRGVRERTAVILGHGEYINRGHSTLVQHVLMVDTFLQVLHQLHPEYTTEQLATLKRALKASLPPLNPETSPGLVPNIIAGRIANRLDLMGPSFVVDGACASSLLAVDIAMRDLLTGRCDLALAGGSHCSTTPPILIIFSQLKGLSRKGQLRSFDADADGTLIGEGAGMLVLKRRDDAERDGDRIYAVIKGIGAASDGRAMGLLAPRLEGEQLAIRRAYEAANVDPSTVELIEGHGTGTLVGDATELDALNGIFGARSGDLPRCALGSVKSMIGHTIPASGIASIIKMALSLYHKVLPPTLHADRPNARLEAGTSNLYLNTETRPWIHGTGGPRRAALNAFGFGGINAHAVLEEYDAREAVSNLHQRWNSELFVVSGTSREEVVSEAVRLRDLASHVDPETSIKDLAWSVNCAREFAPVRLAVVAVSLADLVDKLDRALERLAEPRTQRIRDGEGIYYFGQPLGHEGKLAFVFPGEGAQYVNMLAELCLHFPEVRHMFDVMDLAFASRSRGYRTSEAIFPPPSAASADHLWAMDAGAEAVFCANQALFALLRNLEIRVDAMVGHSTGEHSALVCSGAVAIAGDSELMDRIRTVNSVFERLRANDDIPERTLMAVGGTRYETLEALVERARGDLYIAMDNCPNQVVLCGTDAAVSRAMESLSGSAAVCQRLPFSRAYHTPWFESFGDLLRPYFDSLQISKPRVPLYSCVHADRIPEDPSQIREIGAVSWARTVRFRETIQKMYADGIRIFVEVGPRGILRSFIEDILRGKPHAALPADVQHRTGILQLHHMLAQLVAHGVPVRLEHLYGRRNPQPIERATSARKMTRLDLSMQPMRLPKDFALAQPKLPAYTNPQKPVAAVRDPQDGPVWPAVSAMPVTQPIASSAPEVPAACLPPRAVVMQQHLKTMEQFLQVQQQVMGNLLALADARVPPFGPPQQSVSATPPAVPRQYPFVSEVLELQPGLRARAIYRFRQEPLFEHHALGREISEQDPDLVGLPIVPLTVSVEILAEAAALVEPGKVVVGMRDMRSHRWIMLDGPGPAIELTAERIEAGVVSVKMREADPARQLRPVWIEAVVLLADGYPPTEPPLPFHLQNEQVSKWVPGSLYPYGMFHGPLLRGLISIDRTAVNGATATMQILRHDVLFDSERKPRFVLDPVTLDAAGQLVSFWSQEQLDPVCDFFPYRFETLKCFAPMPPVGTRLEGRILVEEVTSKAVRCNLEVLDLSGNVLYRLENWEDRRFPQWSDLWAFRISPRDTVLSKPSPELVAERGQSAPLVCCRLDCFAPGYLEASYGVWLKMLALLILGREERRVWNGMPAGDKRRSEWLLGRCAAKDAVRLLVKQQFGIKLWPADIGITADARGKPQVSGAWTSTLNVQPVVSIAHSQGVAVALAALQADQMVGVDVESISGRQAGFEALAFTPEEQQLLSQLPRDQQLEWSLRMWGAKEALAKALGRGLAHGLHSLRTLAVEPSGVVQMTVFDGLLQEFPFLAGKQMPVFTKREQDFIYSTVVCEQGKVQ